jgi:hypothetical protein
MEGKEESIHQGHACGEVQAESNVIQGRIRMIARKA